MMMYYGIQCASVLMINGWDGTRAKYALGAIHFYFHLAFESIIPYVVTIELFVQLVGNSWQQHISFLI